MSSLPYQDLSPAELDELLSAVLPEIPGYRVLRLLGRGGMSYVYLGIQESLDRQVAIKVISPLALNDEVSLHRFEKEARTIAKLQHPDIVGIHAVGRMEWGLLYYVMPYLSHGHLGSRDLRGDQAQVIAVLRTLLGALDYAHAQGVVHRDVKAENVLFDQSDRIMLTDFGIATSRRDRGRMTGVGTAIGSWGYMAPEQARGEQVDGRADLYSVGVLAFEMLTGRLPYRNEDTVALALMHAMDAVPLLPPDKAHWQAFIERAMAKSPDARFASAREMRQALDHIALPLPKGEPKRLNQPRLPAAAWATLGAVLVLLVVLVAGLWRNSQRSEAPVALPQESPATPGVPPAVAALAQEVSGMEPEPNALVADVLDQALDLVPDLPPGEAALTTAGEQIRRHRLTQPAGASALDSLVSAHEVLGKDARVTAQAERWFAALQPYLETALVQRDDAAAQTMLAHAARLETALALHDSNALTRLRAVLPDAVRADLRAALDASDLSGLRAARQRAEALGVDGALLEPEFSQTIVTAKPGDALPGGTVPSVIVQLPEGTQDGWAAMPAAVTHGQYAAFANATSRPTSQCRIRTTAMTVRTRTWQAPGFAQSPEHPVVCVNLADAQAYAAWVSQRDGVTWRLPTGAQWQQATGVSGRAACGEAGVACQRDGTAAITAGKQVQAMLGNVREWPGDCAGCSEHPLLGLGWRDATPSRRGNEVNPQFGYDDVSFRLVREVPREAVEQR